MPVVTRNAKHISTFNSEILPLLYDATNAPDKTSKMIISTEIFSKVNETLETILRNNLTPYWISFTASIYNKTTEFEEQYKAKEFDNINPTIVETHANEYMKARKFTSSFLKNISDPRILKDPYIAETVNNIKKGETSNACHETKPITNLLTNMQVVTRSAKKVSHDATRKFIGDITQLLNDMANAEDKTTKMIRATETFNKINENLETILRYNYTLCWIKFTATVYNKTSEFEEQYKAKEFDNIHPSIVKTHVKEYRKARKFTRSFLQNIRNPSILKDPYIDETVNNIKKEDAIRRGHA
jgi:hypothetical protein